MAATEGIERVPGEAAHRCKVAGSFEQQARKLIHFAGKSALDIGGCSRETVRLLMEHNLISNFDDIFELTKDELLELEGFEEKKADNLIKAIIAAKKVPLDRLLIGLGIPHVGGETAFLLATHFNTLAALRAASEESLSHIDGIGPIIGNSVHTWYAQQRESSASRTIAKTSEDNEGYSAIKGSINRTDGRHYRHSANALARRSGGTRSPCGR